MMSPAGGRHGRIAGKVYRRIANFVEQNQLGETYAAETGFLLSRSPDTVRAPDVAFVSHDRLGALADHPGFLPLAPDLVADEVSPSDKPSDLDAKADAWLEAGVRVVLVANPQAATVLEYRTGIPPRHYSDGFVDLSDVLSGFQLDVAELFS